MRTALNLPESKLNDAERSFVANIREHGWFCTSVFCDGKYPDFSYTTGFWIEADHPELIMFGIDSKTAHAVFWDLFRDAKAGRPLLTGKPTDRAFDSAQAYVFPVSGRSYQNHLGWSRWFYGGNDFPCLQIVWPDRSGIFPWEADFDMTFASDQIDLTERGWASALA